MSGKRHGKKKTPTFDELVERVEALEAHNGWTGEPAEPQPVDEPEPGNKTQDDGDKTQE